MPNGARQTARVLHSLSQKEGLPWHRVVRADGAIALEPGSGLELQAALLRAEGVEVSKDGRIAMEKYGHRWKESPETKVFLCLKKADQDR
jgi:methylated-DNA-protein-cysteine methyltransferase-like protein